MKKKIIIGSIIMIMLITVIFALSDNKVKNNNISENQSAFKYYYKSSSLKGEDGWYYFFLIGKTVNEKNTNVESVDLKTTNFYDSVNLKYDKLDNYNILVYDLDTDEIIDRVPTSPSYSVSDYAKNGVTERDEIKTLNEFFDEKQFNKEITLKDLKDLELHNFSKEDIVYIYNETVKQEFSCEVGKFTLFSGEIRRDAKKDGYNWQVGMLQQRAVAQNIMIDIDYGNNIYLSDLIDSNKASKRQKEIYSYLEEIENCIVENQDVDFKGKFDDLKQDEDFKRLFTLLGTLDDGWSN